MKKSNKPLLIVLFVLILLKSSTIFYKFPFESLNKTSTEKQLVEPKTSDSKPVQENDKTESNEKYTNKNSTSSDTNKPSKTTNSSDKNNNNAPDSYLSYSSEWIDNTYSSKEPNRVENYMKVNVSDNNDISGTISSTKVYNNKPERIASIEFKTKLNKDGSAEITFDNDGYGNSGEITLKLSNNKISSNVSITNRPKSGSLWSLQEGNFVFIKKLS